MIIREIYMNQIRSYINTPVIKVITGMRRSGKSALLELTRDELKRSGISDNNIIYINFESLRYADLKTDMMLYQHIMDLSNTIKGKIYILLDEIQEVDDWEKIINSFRVDLDCDIYVTGSNAKLLSGELATLLAGRYVEIHVYPLSFSEYIKFTENDEEGKNKSIDKKFADYIRYGGLPGIHQLKWDEKAVMQYLEDIYNSVILKDVVQRNNIRDTALLEAIIHYLMDNIGNTFSAKTVSDFLKSQGRKLSVETVYNYIEALQSAFIINKVKRFDIKGKKILETQEKYYMSDLGLRHAVMGYNDNDISGVLENVVYEELLRRGYKVYIGKQGVAEVDFVAENKEDRIYIQVCYILHEGDIEREFAPLEAISDNYEKIVISADSLMKINRNGIKQKYIIDFLLSK